MLELTMYNNVKIPQIGFGVYHLMKLFHQLMMCQDLM